MSGHVNFDFLKGAMIPGREPEGLLKDAYSGAIDAVGQAVHLLNRAIGEYGADRPVGYPDTAYYLPVIYSLSGEKIETLGQCAPVLTRLQSVLAEDPRCLDGYLFAGEAAWYAAEIIDAVRRLPHTPAPEGFLGDSVIRRYGIKMADWTIPGEVLIMGSAGDAKELAAAIDKLAGMGFMIFLCGGVIDQLPDPGLIPGVDSMIYPLGDFSRAIQFPSFILRAGTIIGGVEAGQRNGQLDFQRRRIRSFILYLGKHDPFKTALCMGALSMGIPVITDQPLSSDRRIEDWFVSCSGLDKAIQLGMELREIKITNIRIDAPIEIDPAYEGESIRKSDLAVEFGGGRTTGFELVRMAKAEEVEDGKVTVAGPDADTAEPGGAMPLGIVVDVYGRRMREDFESVLERRIHYYINHGEGLWHTGHRDALWMRISKDAFALGFRMRHIGNILYARLKAEFAAIVDRVQVTIYTDEQKVLDMRELARSFYKKRDDHLKALRDEIVDTFYSCTLCQSVAPAHVCVITPERAGQCGAVSWLDARAACEINPGGVNQPVPKEGTIDEIKGQWEAVNEFVYNNSQHSMDKVNLYTLMEHPMASSSCLDCILAVVPECNGFIAVHREYQGMNPTGMTFSAIAGMIGNGAQVPGFMGIARSYLASRKFVPADGGLGRLIWMPRDLKEQLRPLLEVAAEELWGLGKGFVDQIADEKTGVTCEEILPFLKDMGHPALTMDPLV